jgi:soluble lytic murein transglycosylase-like protein
MDKLISLIAAALLLAAPVQAVEPDPWRAAVSEASARFEIPQPWIRAVIDAESGGDPRAVSSRGAMGLMQLMPGTWASLSERLDLGADPFDPRANILAGTAYLADLRDRFGIPGVFAAYNAGPTRYAAHLRGERNLPQETKAYLKRIQNRLSGDQKEAPNGQSGGLFFPLSTAKKGKANGEKIAESGLLFVPLSTRKGDRK